MHSYICITAFHLGTIDVSREGCDVEAEPEDGKLWTRLEDGRMDPMTEGRCSLSSFSLTNSDLVLITGKPRCMSYYFKL